MLLREQAVPGRDLPLPVQRVALLTWQLLRPSRSPLPNPLQDGCKGNTGAASPAGSAFGASPAFGASSSPFGAPSSSPAFGAASSPAFGASAPAFGATSGEPGSSLERLEDCLQTSVMPRSSAAWRRLAFACEALFSTHCLPHAHPVQPQRLEALVPPVRLHLAPAAPRRLEALAPRRPVPLAPPRPRPLASLVSCLCAWVSRHVTICEGKLHHPCLLHQTPCWMCLTLLHLPPFHPPAHSAGVWGH